MTQEELDLIGKKIDEKAQRLADETKSLNEKTRNELAAEIKADMAKYVEEYKKLNEDFKTLQGSVDALAAEKKRLEIQQVAENFSAKLNSELMGADFKNYIDRKKSGKKAEYSNSFENFDLKTITVSTATQGVVSPQYINTIAHEPDRKKHVRDIIPVAPTSSNRVVLPVEATISDGTAVTAEGNAKGASQFTLDIQTFPVMKIAAALKISEEMLDDIPGLTAYIVARWGNKLSNKEDLELLYNTASAIEFGGITTVAQAYEDVLGDTNVTRWDVLRAAITQAKVDEYAPNHIVLHPTDVMHLRNVKDTTGNYIGGAAPWNPAQLMVDGVPVFETTAINVGEFLVGDFSMGCQIFDRKTPSIRFYDQDEDNAQKNLITVIVEERLTLAIIRANAFIYGTFAEALAKGSA